MARWTVSRITSGPTVSDGDADDPAWYPLQHALSIDMFGVNLFVASRADQMLVEEHDERLSGQQELYLVLEADAVFKLDDEQAQLEPWRSPRGYRSFRSKKRESRDLRDGAADRGG
jgi:hypothetical protein